jgi:bifunctional non-homologous end joining protein LigD
LEGVSAKRANSIYVSRRSRDWLKIKCWEEQEFIVGGFTDPKGARVGLGALLLGYYESGELRYRKSSVLRLRRK